MKSTSWKAVSAMLLALAFALPLAVFRPAVAAGAASSDDREVQLFDFRGNGRHGSDSIPNALDADGVLSTIENEEGTDAAKQAKKYVSGGDPDGPNLYTLRYSGEIEAGEKTVSGAEVIGQSQTGDLFVALGPVGDNDKANENRFTEENAPAFKDYESFNIRFYCENATGIEYVLVRLSDSYLQKNTITDHLAGRDFGWQYKFGKDRLTDGWGSLEMDLTGLENYDASYKSGETFDGKDVGGKYFLANIPDGIKGNRPDEADGRLVTGTDPLLASYVQVVVLFNELATPDDPARIVFDSFNLSKDFVSPVLTRSGTEGEESSKVQGTTGTAVSLKELFTATDNRDAADALVYSLSVGLKNARGGYDNINANQIDNGSISFTPYKKGDYRAIVTATDTDGNEGKLTFFVSVTGDDIDRVKPTVKSDTLKELQNLSPVKTFDPIDLTVVKFTDDVDKSDVTYEYSVVLRGENKPYAVTDGKFTPDKNGTYTVTITAKDKAGNEGVATVNITVNNPDYVADEPGGTTPGGNTPGGTTPGGSEGDGPAEGGCGSLIGGSGVVIASVLGLAALFTVKKSKRS